MRLPELAASWILGLAFAQTRAQATTFDFSFCNNVGNVYGTVTGVIYGLATSGTSSATDIVVTGAAAGVGFASFPVEIFALTGWSVVINSKPSSVTLLGSGLLGLLAFGYCRGRRPGRTDRAPFPVRLAACWT